jgi:hypothetical protein
MRFITIAIASAVLFFPTFWLFSAVVGVDWGAGIAAVAMYVAFPILGLKIWRPPASQNLASMESALAAGELGTTEYEISEVVEIEECEDEGKHFFLAIGPSETLFLSGQYLYDVLERGNFPSSRICLFWHKSLGVTYGVQSIGEPIQPKVRLPAFTDEQCDKGVPRDREVLPRSIHEATTREA